MRTAGLTDRKLSKLSRYELAVFHFLWKHHLLPPGLHTSYTLADGRHPSVEVRLERLRMLQEELAELAGAMHEEAPLPEVADALGDLLYVLVGTFLDYGIPLDPVFDEVHRSNMTKEVGSAPALSKKPVKGVLYEPPRLKEVLASCTGTNSKEQ